MSSPKEFSFVIRDAGLCSGPFKLELTQDQRDTLAHRFGLLSIDQMRAAGMIAADQTFPGWRIQGALYADVLYQSVQTLRPLPVTLHLPFELVLVPGSWLEIQREGNPSFDIDLAFDIEAFDEKGLFDLGEWLAQTLSLSLMDYPEETQISSSEKSEGDQTTQRPFQNLNNLLRWSAEG